jgi:uncharacterized protein YcfL
MKRNILNKVFLVVLVLTFGCKAKKEVATVTPARSDKKSALSKSALLKNISNKQLDFATLQVKANASLLINNRGNDAAMNIRIKKDKVIWVRVTAIAGIEIARALITPDSIKVLNRMESVYLVKPFNYITQYANEQINFNTLQALLIGNTLPDVISDESDVRVQNNQLILSRILKGLAYTVNYDANTKVIQTKLVDEDANQQLTASYTDFFVVSDRVIPHSIDIRSAANRKNVNLQLKFTQVDVNESLEYPFSVPKRFTVIN